MVMTNAREWIQEYGPIIAGTYILGGTLKFLFLFSLSLITGFNMVSTFGWLFPFVAVDGILRPMSYGWRFAVPGYALAVVIGVLYQRRGPPGTSVISPSEIPGESPDSHEDGDGDD